MTGLPRLWRRIGIRPKALNGDRWARATHTAWVGQMLEGMAATEAHVIRLMKRMNGEACSGGAMLDDPREPWQG